MKNQLVLVFFDMDLRNGHDGLTLEAKKKKIDILSLKEGESVAFLNRERTKLKLLIAGNEAMFYLRQPRNQPICIETILELPKYLSGGTLNYRAALKDHLEKQLPHLVELESE